LIKTCSSPSLNTGGGPIGGFENLLLNQNCKEDLGILYLLTAAFLATLPLISGKAASKPAGL